MTKKRTCEYYVFLRGRSNAYGASVDSCVYVGLAASRQAAEQEALRYCTPYNGQFFEAKPISKLTAAEYRDVCENALPREVCSICKREIPRWKFEHHDYLHCKG